MGIIIGKKLLDQSGITPSSEVTIEVKDGSIVITPVRKRPPINRDLSTWDAQFKEAFKDGHKPEGDMWEGMINEFDKTEWTWPE